MADLSPDQSTPNLRAVLLLVLLALALVALTGCMVSSSQINACTLACQETTLAEVTYYTCRCEPLVCPEVEVSP